MKFLYFLSTLALLVACSQEKHKSDNNLTVTTNEKLVPEFQELMDSSLCKGSILIYDSQDKTYYSNDFEWAKKGLLPASTFKITNSIIALELGLIENDSTILKWNGDSRQFEIWEQDLTHRDAFHFSCVPCYQEIAREIGVDRMRDNLARLKFGQMEVDTTTLDIFWLDGDSKITQFEQIDFLNRFYSSELPISARTEEIMKRLMVIESTEAYTLSGKTGWSMRNGNNNGWFVGYIENRKGTYFFAVNVIPEAEFNMDLFPIIRKELAYKALKQLDIIQ